jgi:hypothetical protein
MKCAIALTEPLSSMSLPNSAPSKNKGKNWPMNVAVLDMNVCVQWASTGSLANTATTTVAAGAMSRMLQPR